MIVKILFLLVIFQFSKANADSSSIIKEFEPLIWAAHNDLLILKDVTVETEFETLFQDILKSIDTAEQTMNLNTENILKKIESETSNITCNPEKVEECLRKKNDDINTWVVQPPLAHTKTCVNLFFNKSTGHFKDFDDKINKNITDLLELNGICTQFSSNADMRWCFFNELSLKHFPNIQLLNTEFENVLDNIVNIVEEQKIKLNNCIDVLARNNNAYASYPINFYKSCCT